MSASTSMRPVAPVPSCDVEHHCITCGDDGVPMRVLRVYADRGLAECADDSGALSAVEIELVAPVAPGDAVLVHAGTALTRLEEMEVAL